MSTKNPPAKTRRPSLMEANAKLRRENKQLRRDLEARNTALAAEVASLRDGREAIEEQARMQLNMIRGDETFFQFVPAPAAPAVPAKPTR